MANLIISCMDYRLNEFIESEYKDDIVIRNAGANVKPIMHKIKRVVEDKNIKEISVIAHTDCGAMGKVFEVIKNEAKCDEDLKESLVNQFENLNFKTKSDLESINLDVQVSNLKEAFPNLNISRKIVDLDELGVSKYKGEHKLIVANPSKPDYKGLIESLYPDINGAYIIQSDFDGSIPDIKLAVSDLGVKSINVITIDKENPRFAKANSEKLKLLFRNNDLNQKDITNSFYSLKY